MTEYSSITEKIRKHITRKLGPECIISDPDILEEFNRDASDLRCNPEMVVKVRSSKQVQELLHLANAYRFPVTPRGAGTGLAGGCLPACGGVILSLEEMNRIRTLDIENFIAEVEPGVITKDLRDSAKDQGLFYPPDPASLEESTIGGNAATNAGGPACVKYGTTKNYILGLEAVLANGQMIRTGVKTRKGVVGYDLTHLLVGSEGTLGVITGLTLKLIPHPSAVTGVSAVFKSLQTAMQTVTQIMVNGHLPSAIEFMDHKCLAIVGDLLPFAVPGEKASLLIIETDGDVRQIENEIEIIGRLCTEAGATHLLPAPDATERERIWDVRRQVSRRIQDNANLYVPEDVAVPINRIAELVDALPEFEEKYGLEIYTFGHAGDGNIHISLSIQNLENIERVEKCVEAIYTLVLKMNGTLSGEHGIGMAKKKFLSMELSAESIRLQQGIKKLFDPNLILNPSKIFPDESLFI